MRSFRTLAPVLFAVAMALIVATPGVVAKEGRFERRVGIVATGAGQANDVSGYARVRQDGSRQRLTVEVEARVKSGTRYDVLVTNGGGAVKVATIRIGAGGEGQVEFKNFDGKTLPAGVGPVRGITKVIITDRARTVVGTATF